MHGIVTLHLSNQPSNLSIPYIFLVSTREDHIDRSLLHNYEKQPSLIEMG